MKVIIRLTKEQFDKFVTEQHAPGVHESELEISVINQSVSNEIPDDIETVPVLRVEADNVYQE